MIESISSLFSLSEAEKNDMIEKNYQYTIDNFTIEAFVNNLKKLISS